MSGVATTPLSALAALLGGEPLPWSALETEPDTFLAACAAADLAPVLWWRLHGSAAYDGWPPLVRDALATKARAALAAELLVRRELARVLQALARRGVRPLLFKGTALAYDVYPAPSLRPRNDTDLLIRESDVSTVREVMNDLRYTAAVQCDGDLLFRQFELRRRDDLGATYVLDFHWAISMQAAFADVLAYEELWRRAVPLAALGPNAAAPGLVDALLLALIHPVMHHKNEERLLWTYDVHLLARQLDAAGWSELVERALAKRIAAVCERGLERARDWFATAVPEGVLAELHAMPEATQPTAAYLAAGRSWLDETGASLRGLGWRDRVRLLQEIGFPSPSYMLRAYRLPDSRWGRVLLPALYAHRGLRGVVRVLRGTK